MSLSAQCFAGFPEYHRRQRAGGVGGIFVACHGSGSGAVFRNTEQPRRPVLAMGTGYYGGIIDYLNYVNMKHGNNGVQLTYEAARNRIQRRAHRRMLSATVEQGRSEDGRVRHAGHAGESLCTRMAPDNVVLAQYGYGRTDAADGRVWPWVFNAAGHYWGQIAVQMNFMAEQEVELKMQGKTIVHLHIDTAGGRNRSGHARDRQGMGREADRDRGSAAGARAAVAMAPNPP